MEPALWISKTGLEAQNQNIAVIANNLANVSTIGYKKERAAFEDLIYQNLKQPGAKSSENTEIPTGIMMGTGTHLVATEKIFTQGSIQNTENPTDVAIEGRGFLQVLMPDGTLAYTRDGQLNIDSQGQITTSNGYVIQPPITVPQQVLSMSISSDGIVSVMVAGNNTPNEIGRIQLSDFLNPTGLQPIGQNLFVQTVASGDVQTDNPGNSGLGN